MFKRTRSEATLLFSTATPNTTYHQKEEEAESENELAASSQPPAPASTIMDVLGGFLKGSTVMPRSESRPVAPNRARPSTPGGAFHAAAVVAAPLAEAPVAGEEDGGGNGSEALADQGSANDAVLQQFAKEQEAFKARADARRNMFAAIAAPTPTSTTPTAPPSVATGTNPADAHEPALRTTAVNAPEALLDSTPMASSVGDAEPAATSFAPQQSRPRRLPPAPAPAPARELPAAPTRPHAGRAAPEFSPAPAPTPTPAVSVTPPAHESTPPPTPFVESEQSAQQDPAQDPVPTSAIVQAEAAQPVGTSTSAPTPPPPTPTPPPPTPPPPTPPSTLTTSTPTPTPTPPPTTSLTTAAPGPMHRRIGDAAITPLRVSTRLDGSDDNDENGTGGDSDDGDEGDEGVSAPDIVDGEQSPSRLKRSKTRKFLAKQKSASANLLDARLKLYREDLAEWISAMLGVDPVIEPANLLTMLQDGTVVCRLAHEVHVGISEWKYNTAGGKPAAEIAPPKYKRKVRTESFQARDNVHQFLVWAKALGCPCLFESEDLVLRKQELLVYYCLMDVARGGCNYLKVLPQLVTFEQEIDLYEGSGSMQEDTLQHTLLVQSSRFEEARLAREAEAADRLAVFEAAAKRRREEEKARLAAEAAQQAEEEAQQLAEEEAKRKRAEEAAARRVREEADVKRRAAEATRLQAEAKRLEEERLAAAEARRLAAEMLAAAEAEERARLEALAAEQARLEAEAAERARVAAEELDRAKREADAAEKARVEAEAAAKEQERLDALAIAKRNADARRRRKRLNAEAEEARVAAEAAAAEEAADLAAELAKNDALMAELAAAEAADFETRKRNAKAAAKTGKDTVVPVPLQKKLADLGIVPLGKGKYRLDDSQFFVRICRKHIVVRVGGGWDTLENYLFSHFKTRPAVKGLTLVRDDCGIPRWEKAADLGDLLKKSKRKEVVEITEETAREAAAALKQGTDHPDLFDEGQVIGAIGGFAVRPSRRKDSIAP